MDDVRYDFFEDCKDKKITARSARNKKTHTGKGGRVRLPSDHLTKKEREAMNGECKSYRMNDPISWEEFKSWPKEHQETYIKLLRKKFNVPAGDISEMMGMHRSTLSYHIKKNKLNVGEFTSGNYTWDKEGFLAWRGGAKDGVVQPSETPVEEEVEDTAEQSDEIIVINEVPEIDIPDLEEKIKETEEDVRKEALEELCESFTNTGIHVDKHNYIHNEKKAEPNWFRDIKMAESSCEAKTVIPECGEMTFQGNADDILRTIAKLLDGRQVRLEVEWEVLG